MKKQNQNIGQKGAAAVEFAIVLPMLVLLVFGTIEFGLMFFNKQVVTNASREGARAGIAFAPTPLDDSGIAGVVNTYCASNLITFGSATAAATAVSRGGSGTAGDPLTVTVNYPYEFLVLPNFVTALTGPIDLQAVTVMRME